MTTSTPTHERARWLAAEARSYELSESEAAELLAYIAAAEQAELANETLRECVRKREAETLGACAGLDDANAALAVCHEMIQHLEREREKLKASQSLLLQVAVEAIRLVHGSQLGDHYSHEPCGECGLGGAGALREALAKSLGVGYTSLVWGKDMNADWEALRQAAAKAIAETLKT